MAVICPKNKDRNGGGLLGHAHNSGSTRPGCLTVFDNDRWFRWGLLVVTAVALAVRLFRLGAESYWFDECMSIAYARLPLSELITASPTNPPLYYLVLKGWSALFGQGDVISRVPAVLGGAATVTITALIGRRLFFAGVGLAAAMLLALSAYHVNLSQEVRMYSIFGLAVAVAMWLFLKMVQPADPQGTLPGEHVPAPVSNCPPARVWGSYTLASMVMLYLHPYAVFVIIAQNSWVLIRTLAPSPDRFRHWKQWLIAQGIIVLSFLPWLWRVLTVRVGIEIAAQNLERPGIFHIIELLKRFSGYTRTTLFLYGLAILSAMWWTWRHCQNTTVSSSPCAQRKGREAGDPSRDDRGGSAGSIVRPRQEGADNTNEAKGEQQRCEGSCFLLFWLLLITLLPFLLSQSSIRLFVYRYHVAQTIPFFLLAVFGISALPRRWWQSLGLIVLLAGQGYALVDYCCTVNHEPWRRFVARIEAEADSRDILLFNVAYVNIGYQAYATKDVPQRWFWQDGGFSPLSPGRVENQPGGNVAISAVGSNQANPTPMAAERLWVLLWNPAGREAAIRRRLSSDFHCVRREEALQLTLLVFQAGQDDTEVTDPRETEEG